MTLDDIYEWFPLNLILLRIGCLEDHNAAELLWISALVHIDQVDHVIRCNIHLGVVGQLCQRRSRETNVKLDVLVHGLGPDEVHPSIEGDDAWRIPLLAVGSIEVGARRALGRVIKLNEQEIEPRGLDGVCQVGVRNDTLRRARDIVLLLSIGDEESPQDVNHGSISAVLSGSVVVRNITLNVEIESVDDSIAERPRSIISVIHGAKGIP